MFYRVKTHNLNFVETGNAIGVICVKSAIRRTDKLESTTHVAEWAMLTKSLLPLPDKYEGLTYIDKIHRHRYLDVIVFNIESTF